MEKTCCLYLGLLGVILSIVCLTFISPSKAFNIDTNKSIVFRGEAGSGFGTTAEFILNSTGDTQLLVGAPQQKAASRQESGIYYLCSPHEAGVDADRQCKEQWSKPQPWPWAPGAYCPEASRPPANASMRFGEEKELFGQTMTPLNETSVLVCGPMWSDLCYWNWHYIFNIGRCCIVPAQEFNTAGFSPYRGNPKSIYMKYFLLGAGNNTNQSDAYYGYAQFGFSAAADGKGHAVMGAPGFRFWQGGLAAFDEATGKFTIMEDEPYDRTPNNYFGYSVAIGNFCGPNKFCFAVSDRNMFGRVRIIRKLGSKGNDRFKLLDTVSGTQEYASFGYSLAAKDVNGDGWSDLLVGAPLFTDDASRSYDEGRVFVYLAQGKVTKGGEQNFKMPMELCGDRVSFARFGSAISSIGDINRDSYLDVAVGAPQEGGGVGAVYVYLGGPQGVVTPYTQKVTGRDFQPQLRSFGSYISQPTSHLNSYGYPEFAVGCPASDSVVIYRTRRILNPEVRIEATPNPVAIDNQHCLPDLDRLGNLRASGCFDVDVYFGHAASSTEPKTVVEFDLQYTLTVDARHQRDDMRRVRLLQKREDGSYHTTTTVGGNVSVSSTKETPLHFTAILREDKINLDRFQPVQLLLTFALNSTEEADLTPVLNRSVSTTVTEEVAFLNEECGEDKKCQPDLILSGSLQHVPSLVNFEDSNVVNYTRKVELHLKLVNKNETAFATRLTTTITGQIAFKTITSTRSRSHFIYEPPEHVTSAKSTVLVFSNLQSLDKNEAVDVTLHFEAESVPLDPDLPKVTFDVEAMPYQAKENPDNDTSDNVVKLESHIRIVADVAVDGASQPRSKHVSASDASDLLVKHRLYLSNGGPSFLPPTHVNVSIPFRNTAGKELFETPEMQNVTIKYEDGRTAGCRLLTPAGGSFAGTNSPPPATTPSQSTTASLPGEVFTTSTINSPFFPEEPVRRRRSADDMQSDDIASNDGGNDRLFRMDCASYTCIVYQCPLPALQPEEDAEINITLSLVRSSLPLSDKVDTLVFVTNTEVGSPDHALFYPWPVPKEMEVHTYIFEVKPIRKKVNLWIIIGGVLGGLLLLLIIAVIAWKLGFFTRKDRAKLERLKRQSGFYGTDSNKEAYTNKSTEELHK